MKSNPFMKTVTSLSFLILVSINANAFKPKGNWIQFSESYKEEINLARARCAYKKVLVEGDASGLNFFDQNYIQHNPLAPNGRNFLSQFFIENRPENLAVEIGMVIADGDFVAIQSRISGLEDSPLIAVDIFRVIDGVIVEHWDVTEQETPAGNNTNGSSAFPVVGSLERSRVESSNRKRVIHATNQRYGLGNADALKEFWTESFIEIPSQYPENGGTIIPLNSIAATQYFNYQSGFAMAYGDLVMLQTRFTNDNETRIGIDFYRIENGLIAQHWGVDQKEVPITETVSGNPMFPIF